MGKIGSAICSSLAAGLAFAILPAAATQAATITRTVLFGPHETDSLGECLTDPISAKTIGNYESEFGPGVTTGTVVVGAHGLEPRTLSV